MKTKVRTVEGKKSDFLLLIERYLANPNSAIVCPERPSSKQWELSNFYVFVLCFEGKTNRNRNYLILLT